MAKPNPNRLLVEGDEDKRVIPYFMENFIPWGNNKSTWPVEIESFNGISELVTPGTIEAELKTSGLKALGIIADANDDPANRWASIRTRALKAFPALPENLPAEGLIEMNADGLRFGVWLMPDNTEKGMLETFLGLFVPLDGQSLWDYTEITCTESKKHNAPFKDAHRDKVRIHTWLSWQDPPGQSLHLAVLSQALKPGSPKADPFVKWFRTLFQL
jgi:hypothetical protein